MFPKHFRRLQYRVPFVRHRFVVPEMADTSSSSAALHTSTFELLYFSYALAFLKFSYFLICCTCFIISNRSNNAGKYLFCFLLEYVGVFFKTIQPCLYKL